MGQTNDKEKRPVRRARSAGTAERFNDAKFVQYELDKVEQQQCKAWALDAADAWAEMLPLLDEGYSFTVKFDGFSNCYACFVQVRGVPDHANSGLILTGRGSEPFKAVKQALFKHKAIDATWLPYAERRYPDLDD